MYAEMASLPSGPPRLVYVLVEWRLSRDPRKSRPDNKREKQNLEKCQKIKWSTIRLIKCLNLDAERRALIKYTVLLSRGPKSSVHVVSAVDPGN